MFFRILTCLLVLGILGCSSGSESNNNDGTDSSTDSDTDSDSDADSEVDTTYYDPGPYAINPMPVISRNVPVHTSHNSNTATANDDSYADYYGVFNMAPPFWMIYDLSSVPEEQRQRMLVAWYNISYTYFENVTRSPAVYTIDGHTGAGGNNPPGVDDPDWVTLASVTEDDPNIYSSRQHLISGKNGEDTYNWIRLNISAITADSTSLAFNMDIHDAKAGATDSWLFCGDSITAGAMFQSEESLVNKIEGPNFAQVVNSFLPDFFPAQENTGRGGWTTEDALGVGVSNSDPEQTVVKWLEHFPGKYVAISFGTNDSGTGVTLDNFYDNYVTMVEAVLAADKVPVVPRIPWAESATVQANVPDFNAVIEDLKEAYPEIVEGPDFWTFFSENPNLISDDGLHPSEEGSLAYRRLWAEKMIEEVYLNVDTDAVDSDAMDTDTADTDSVDPDTGGIGSSI